MVITVALGLERAGKRLTDRFSHTKELMYMFECMHIIYTYNIYIYIYIYYMIYIYIYIYLFFSLHVLVYLRACAHRHWLRESGSESGAFGLVF